MRTNLAVASLLASTILFSSTAFADQWRASKLIGLDIYNEQNEKLGDVSEVLLDSSGKVAGFVIGVGGFLGVGQRDVMVSMDKLKFVKEPMRTTSAPAGGGTTGAGGTQTPPAAARTESKWYPDHAVLAGMSKDQIKAMPEFKYE